MKSLFVNNAGIRSANQNMIDHHSIDENCTQAGKDKNSLISAIFVFDTSEQQERGKGCKHDRVCYVKRKDPRQAQASEKDC